MVRKRFAWLVWGALLGGLIGWAWMLPGQWESALLGWAAALTLPFLLHRCPRPYAALYVAGLVANAIGFHWLHHTIGYFGGFPLIFSAPIFLLFLVVSGLQLPLYGLLARALESSLGKYALSGAIAWCAAEFSSVRIFPWFLGHTQLSFSWFAQSADIAGAMLLSFMMVWVSEVLFRSLVLRERNRRFVAPVLFFAVLLRYGAHREEQFETTAADTQKVAIVQANVSVEEKHNQKLVAANIERYRALTKDIPGPDTLVIWPESVITDFIDAEVGSVENDPRLPFFTSHNPLLVGALTYESQERIFNSALAILNSGTVLYPYHKQILMPFGEYTPFGDVVPLLRQINATAADFTPGDRVRVFEYPMPRETRDGFSIRVAPFICYEDIVPHLSRQATKLGAEILVSLSNDAWFGDTVAPHQHHLIAAFRAIENRRYLVRSTNTGLTAVVSATGKTIGALPTFAEGTLLAEVRLLRYTTLYTGVIGDALGVVCAVLAGWSLLLFYLRGKRWLHG